MTDLLYALGVSSVCFSIATIIFVSAYKLAKSPQS